VIIDTHLYDWINRVADHTGWAHPLMVGVAKYGIVLFAVLLVGAYLDARHRGDRRDVAGTVWAGAAALVALGLAQVIGGYVDRARPYTALPAAHVLIARSSDFSFPSDHATAAGAVAVGLLLLHRRRWGIIAAAAAIVMAVARVYVGVHYPGDVLAGLALGGLVAAVGFVLLVPLLTRLVDVLSRSPMGRLLVAGPAV
jgi:membrane-associated phospholipid phosphatase